MSLNNHYKRLVFTFLPVSIIGALVVIFQLGHAAPAEANNTFSPPVMQVPGRAAQNGDFTTYLPIVTCPPPWISPFGVETKTPMVEGNPNFTRTLELKNGLVRLGTHIHWRSLQTNEGDPIQWSQLADFENELLSLKAAGITPLVTITDSPAWATIADYTCGAVRTEKFPAFADFMRQLVARYSSPEFNVHNWELGNEPDVDPVLVPKDSPFGCWGDNMDPYYGGRHYGEMLKVVTPVIKQADALAKVWIGGLLLDRPNTPPNPNCGLPDCGRPELFLKGILVAGASPYFDILAYHAYSVYTNEIKDHDNDLTLSQWYPLGGLVLGKARFLRQITQTYGVDKPLVINEVSLTCPEYLAWCNPPGDSFYQMQADFLVRSFTRALAENITGFYWYTLEGPGWRNSGLLNNGTPNPSFNAYKQLIQRLQNTHYIRSVNYNSGIEAYEFDTRQQIIHVLWAKTDQIINLQIPGAKFIAAYLRDGDPISPTPVGSDYELSVGFSPIYIVFEP